MLQEADIIQYSDSSKKCLKCGLRNFANTGKCRRCKSDLSLSPKSSKDDQQLRDKSAESRRATSRFAWFTTALAIVLLGLAVLYMSPGSQVSPVPVSEAFAQPAAPAVEQQIMDPAQQNSKSEAAVTTVMVELKRFQDAAESGLEYKDYDQKLTSLKSDLNRKLPSFARHNPTDETFRQEVGAALRDYSAAQNWWKTTLTNSSVFTTADRDERTQKNWASARAHLTNAEKMLAP